MGKKCSNAPSKISTFTSPSNQSSFLEMFKKVTNTNSNQKLTLDLTNGNSNRARQDLINDSKAFDSIRVLIDKTSEFVVLREVLKEYSTITGIFICFQFEFSQFNDLLDIIKERQFKSLGL